MNPILRRMIQLLILVFFQAALLFLSAWSLTWVEGWVYVGLYVACLLGALAIFLPTRMAVVVERSKGAQGGKPWDIWLTRLMSVPSLGMLVVAGLAHNHNWLPKISLPWQVAGGFFFVIGYSIVLWAMYTNKYFSSVVRIQSERGHEAVTEGPYHFIRHPGYVGMMTSALGGVLLLGSIWAFIPCGLYAGLVICRTMLEDRTLQAELPGYADYTRKTHFRLFPGIW